MPEALYRRFFDLYLNKKSVQNWSEIYLKNGPQMITKEKVGTHSECKSVAEVDFNKYIGTYYNLVYGDVIISKHQDRLLLTIGPQHIMWQLSPYQNNVLKAYWSNPNGMDVPMLTNSGEDLIEFTSNAGHTVQSMTIPYLNDDGSGIFMKR